MNEIDDNKVNVHTQQEEQEIDLIELVQKIWAERKLILKICSYALLIGLVVAFSIPNEYTTKVTLAPEVSEQSGMEGMGALVAMAGVSLANKSNEDALSVELYPDIVSSTPFLTNLFDVKVSDKKGKIDATLYIYLKEKQHSAWWGYVFSFPFKALEWIRSLSGNESETENRELNPFMLTKNQTKIVKTLNKCIEVSSDKKTKATTLSVTMQDPLISANVTNIVLKNLQDYITDYRTNKARRNLEFTEKLYREAKEDYDTAQQKYAQYTDKNQNTILQMARMEGERLVNEKNLTFDIYTQVAQQLQMARVKVQEITPVYTVVEPATVSLQPSKPNKILILIGFVFLGGVGGIGWIVFMKDFMRSWKEKQMEKSLNL